MSIPARVIDFVEQRNVGYSVVAHPHTQTSMASARTAHVRGEHVAKAVLLEDTWGYVLAVLPATHQLDLAALARRTRRPLSLAPEDHLPDVFSDCAPGAVPALGEAYGIRTIVDDALIGASEVYFEAGDHEELIRVTAQGLRRLLPAADFARISKPASRDSAPLAHAF